MFQIHPEVSNNNVYINFQTHGSSDIIKSKEDPDGPLVPHARISSRVTFHQSTSTSRHRECIFPATPPAALTQPIQETQSNHPRGISSILSAHEPLCLTSSRIYGNGTARTRAWNYRIPRRSMLLLASHDVFIPDQARKITAPDFRCALIINVRHAKSNYRDIEIRSALCRAIMTRAQSMNCESLQHNDLFVSLTRAFFPRNANCMASTLLVLSDAHWFD